MIRDHFAAHQLRSHRVDCGLSPEQFGHLIGVSGHTIRRIERDGVIPTARVQYLIASHFELRPTELWRPLPARIAA